MAIKNFTPHTINIMDTDENQIIAIPSNGTARVTVARTKINSIPIWDERKLESVEIPINNSSFGEVEGLPAEEVGTLLIVSMMVAKALPDRFDLICVDDTVRNKEGQIIGCKAFCRP